MGTLQHVASMKRRCDTSFFYSLAELSKSHIFPSPFSPAFTQVIGHFAANFGQVGCLLPWPDPCCCCNGGQHFYQFAGGFSTLWPPSSLRRELLWTLKRGGKRRELKYDFWAPQWPALSPITHVLIIESFSSRSFCS